MMDYRDVVVLQDARAVRDNLAQELAKRGFAVRSCGSLAGLRHLYAMQPSPLILLTGESDDLACDAQSVRMAAPGAIIIALGTAADTAWRMHAMAAGADACHAASIDIAELIAILLSWGRHVAGVCPVSSLDDAVARVPYRPVDHMESVQRAGPARADLAQARSHPASSRVRDSRNSRNPRAPWDSANPGASVHRSGRLGSGWGLDASCRVLLCPRDRTLFVTAAENSFLMRIAASEGQLLRRRPMAPAGAAVQGSDHPGQDLDARSMDVLVSRLRRKAREAGIELPLLAVRGCGYLFAEPLAVTPSSLLARASVPNARAMPQATPTPLPRTDHCAGMYDAPLLVA